MASCTSLYVLLLQMHWTFPRFKLLDLSVRVISVMLGCVMGSFLFLCRFGYLLVTKMWLSVCRLS